MATNILSIVSFIGSVASCIGLWFSWYQIRKMRSATEASIKATNDAIAKLNREHSIAELAKHAQLAMRIRTYLSIKEYITASLLLTDLRHQSQTFIHIPQLQEYINTRELESYLAAIDRDIIKLDQHSSIKPMLDADMELVFYNLNNLDIFLTNLENKLKYSTDNA